MIQLLLFIGIGLGLLIFLFVFARRAPSAEGSAQGLVEAKHALDTLQSGLLPPELVERIFARADLDYIASVAIQPIQKEFLRERRTIALAWVDRVRTQILRLKEFHFRRSRFYSRLSIATEIGLAASFTFLLLQCRALQLAVLLGGSNAAPRMVERTAAAAARLCAVSEKSLAFLSPVLLTPLDKDSPGGGAIE